MMVTVWDTRLSRAARCWHLVPWQWEPKMALEGPALGAGCRTMLSKIESPAKDMWADTGKDTGRRIRGRLQLGKGLGFRTNTAGRMPAAIPHLSLTAVLPATRSKPSPSPHPPTPPSPQPTRQTGQAKTHPRPYFVPPNFTSPHLPLPRTARKPF